MAEIRKPIASVWMARRRGSLLLLSVVLWCGAAGAIQHVRSLYTALDLARCELIAGRDGSVRLCPGLPGYPVYMAEDGNATYLSIGRDAAERMAARQTLKANNTLFHEGARRTTVEWRFVVRDKRTVPYATIVRYFTHSETQSGEVLVVMRVTPRESCQVAHIDALANANAIKIARKVADTVARKEDCPVAPQVLGTTGRSPM